MERDEWRAEGSKGNEGGMVREVGREEGRSEERMEEK